MPVWRSGYRDAYKILTASYTILDYGPNFFDIDSSGGDVTATLPTLADNYGRLLTFHLTDATNTGILDGEGAETIDGSVIFILKRLGHVVVLYADPDAAEWRIVSGGLTNLCHHVDIAIPKRPAANPPGEGVEDNFPTLDFDDGTDESVFFLYELPEEFYKGGNIAVELTWFVDTAPAGVESVVWGLEYKKQSEGDNFDFGAGTTTATDTEVVTAGTPANDKKLHRTTFPTLFAAPGALPHDYFLVRIYRDADNVADDFTGDARLVSINVNIEAVWIKPA